MDRFHAQFGFRRLSTDTTPQRPGPIILRSAERIVFDAVPMRRQSPADRPVWERGWPHEGNESPSKLGDSGDLAEVQVAWLTSMELTLTF